jgi:hypothetical protein
LSLEAGVYSNGSDFLGSGDIGCPGGGIVTARAVAGTSFFLEKTSPTTGDCAAFIVVNGLGTGKTGLTELSFDWTGAHCGAGAPRFNVTTAGGEGGPVTHFYGCSASTNDARHVSINVGNAALDGNPTGGGISPTDTVTAIAILFDEQGSVTLSNIDVNGVVITTVVEPIRPAPPPTTAPTPTPTATPVATASPTALPITGPSASPISTAQVSHLATTGGGSGVPWPGLVLLLGLGLLLALTGGVVVARSQFRRF